MAFTKATGKIENCDPVFEELSLLTDIKVLLEKIEENTRKV